MKKGDKLFVRFDYKAGEKEVGKKDFNDHIKYLSLVASERYFVGGGFSDIPGGMIMFKAKDISEAREVANKDPLVQRNFYKYKLYEWDIAIVSKIL